MSASSAAAMGKPWRRISRAEGRQQRRGHRGIVENREKLGGKLRKCRKLRKIGGGGGTAKLQKIAKNWGANCEIAENHEKMRTAILRPLIGDASRRQGQGEAENRGGHQECVRRPHRERPCRGRGEEAGGCRGTRPRAMAHLVPVSRSHVRRTVRGSADRPPHCTSGPFHDPCSPDQISPCRPWG